MNEEIKRLLNRIKETADFCYVDFKDINSENILGETALHATVIQGDIEGVRLLVESGAEINKSGEEGFTPLHYACEFEHIEIVRYLIEKGADIHARTEGNTPLQIAKLVESRDAVELLERKLAELKLPKSAYIRHLDALQQGITDLEAKISACKINVSKT